MVLVVTQAIKGSVYMVGMELVEWINAVIKDLLTAMERLNYGVAVQHRLLEQPGSMRPVDNLGSATFALSFIM